MHPGEGLRTGQLVSLVSTEASEPWQSTSLFGHTISLCPTDNSLLDEN